MAKVTLNPAAAPSPSEAIVAAAKKTAETTDAMGRKLVLKKLNALEKVDLARLVGPADVQNQVVFTTYFLAASVTGIDGEVIYPPASLSELRLLVSRLDDEGLEAAGLKVAEAFGTLAIDVQAEALKNS